MPMYEYKCDTENGCNGEHELLLSFSESDNEQLCPDCGGVLNRMVSRPGLCTSDMNMSADTKTGGQWSELMGRIRSKGAGIDGDAKSNIDRAMDHRGRRWKS